MVGERKKQRVYIYIYIWLDDTTQSRRGERERERERVGPSLLPVLLLLTGDRIVQAAKYQRRRGPRTTLLRKGEVNTSERPRG